MLPDHFYALMVPGSYFGCDRPVPFVEGGGSLLEPSLPAGVPLIPELEAH